MSDLSQPSQHPAQRASTQASQAELATRHWLETIVIGLKLCPFAAPVVNAGGLHLVVCDDSDPDAILAQLLIQLDLMQQADEAQLGTTLLVFSQGLQDFEQYWDLVEVAEELLFEAGLEGVIQLATFHPDYLFEGVAADDVSHYTNRSPYPMLHLIREAQLERAIANYPNPENIPADNVRRLQQLGRQSLLELLAFPHS